MRFSRAKIDEAMVAFGKDMIRQARSNLSKGKINASKQLWNSLKFRWEEPAQTMYFTMDAYGDIINSGIAGHGRGNYKSKRKVEKSTKGYKYKTGPGLKSDNPLNMVFQDWIRIKGVQLRNAKGQYISREVASFMIRRNVGRFGIKANHFWDDAWLTIYPKYSETIDKVISSEVDSALEEIISQLKAEN